MAVEVSVFLGTVVFVSIFCLLSEIDPSWSQVVDNKWAVGFLYEVQRVWLDKFLIHSFVNITLNFLYIF